MDDVLKKTVHVEKSRQDKFAEKAPTKIWKEKASDKNPYISANSYIHGYDLLDLASHYSFVDVFFLLFKGELPSKEQASLLESLMIGLISPGPRHPATRSVMEAAVSKTNPAHLLPIGLSVLSGKYLGASEVEASMRFIRKNVRRSPIETIDELTRGEGPLEKIIPGFGSRFNNIDEQTENFAQLIKAQQAASTAVFWAAELVEILNQHNMGWYPTGIAAAVFCDLGFNPKLASGLYQIFSSPGIWAHGAEMTTKSIHDMPFVSEDDFYTIDE